MASKIALDKVNGLKEQLHEYESDEEAIEQELKELDRIKQEKADRARSMDTSERDDKNESDQVTPTGHMMNKDQKETKPRDENAIENGGETENPLGLPGPMRALIPKLPVLPDFKHRKMPKSKSTGLLAPNKGTERQVIKRTGKKKQEQPSSSQDGKIIIQLNQINQ